MSSNMVEEKLSTFHWYILRMSALAAHIVTCQALDLPTKHNHSDCTHSCQRPPKRQLVVCCNIQSSCHNQPAMNPQALVRKGWAYTPCHPTSTPYSLRRCWAPTHTITALRFLSWWSSVNGYFFSFKFILSSHISSGPLFPPIWL